MSIIEKNNVVLPRRFGDITSFVGVRRLSNIKWESDCTKTLSGVSIKSKILLMIVMNLLDAILTYIGISMEYCYELNPIANLFIENIYLVFLFKIFLPSTLLMCVIYYMEKYRNFRVGFVNTFVNIGFFVYIFVSLNHCYVLTQVFCA